jgi:glycosyltransferase involved in cell wall biosynthesis
VIASRNSGAPDLIKDGEHGLLFSYGVNADLEAKLDWALNSSNELTEIGRRARIQAVKCSWEAFTIAFVDWLATSATRLQIKK